MSGTQIIIKDEEVQANLSGMAVRARDLSRGMKVIAALVLASVRRNFELGGRPSKWAPLKPSTLKKRKSNGGPLVGRGFRGGLLQSVHAESNAKQAIVGTDKVYAAVHQFGAAKGSFGMGLAGSFRRSGIMGSLERGGGWDLSSQRPLPWGDIPARPFLVLQEEDRQDAVAALAKYVLGASAGPHR